MPLFQIERPELDALIRRTVKRYEVIEVIKRNREKVNALVSSGYSSDIVAANRIAVVVINKLASDVCAGKLTRFQAVERFLKDFEHYIKTGQFNE